VNIGDIVEQDTGQLARPLSVPAEVCGDSTRKHLIKQGKKKVQKWRGITMGREERPELRRLDGIRPRREILARAWVEWTPVRFDEFDKVDGRDGKENSAAQMRLLR
jgi:hypothetical protein